MTLNFKRVRKKVIKTYVDVISFDEAINKIVNWAEERKSKYVSVMDSNVIVKSWLDLNYREILNTADLGASDGAL